MNDIKQLKGLFSLDHNIRVYVPSTLKGDKKTDNSAQVKEALSLFSDCFGGATSYDAKGAWTSTVHGLIVENVTIVESYGTREQMDKHLETIVKFAGKLKKDMEQEAISLEYDNKLYFV